MVGFNATEFLADGAIPDPSPALLWVSDDSTYLDQALGSLAVQIVEGRAPPPWAGRHLLSMPSERLLAILRQREDPTAHIVTILDEAAQGVAVLAILGFDRLLDSTPGTEFLDGLLSGLLAHRFPQFIGLTDQDGYRRLFQENPRLTALFSVHDLDNDQTFSSVWLTIEAPATDDLGWMIAVRCELTAPVPALDALAFRGQSLYSSLPKELQDLGVEQTFLLALESGSRTLMLTFRDESIPSNDVDTAEQRALAAAGRIIGRPLQGGERLVVSRLLCYVRPGSVARGDRLVGR